jgi:hypothetical protein
MAEYATAAFQEPRRPRTGLWTILIVVFVVVLAAVLYGAFWFDTADRLKTGIQDWIAQQRRAGNFVVLNNLQISGFPLSFTFTADSTVLGRTAERTYSWRAEGLHAVARPWSPRMLRISAPDNGVTYSARGNSRNVELNAASLAATVHLGDRGMVDRFEATFTRPVLHVLGVRDDIAARSLDVRGGGALGGPVSLELEAADVTSGYHLLQRLGGTVDRLKAAADVTGAWAPGEMTSELDAWRRGGGTVEVRDTRLEFGPLKVDVVGTVSLDDQLRPLGALTATFLGLDDFIDRLQKAEIVRPGEAAAAKVSIRVLGEPTESGRLRIPVTAQFGRLSVGPMAVGSLMSVPQMLEIPNLQ